ncbi:hypothetical protein RhiJN_05959 [Ceratobasidium sp. AG-Ba]|nr:hypothetical protein RhiJN_05959 [Ceratobasidium sp. AG-Ba]QRW06884.1 hypothetical protein RhiLY_05883 [Ceratobasidium sp. AG-Ba]
MVSRLQLNLRSEAIISPTVSSSDLPRLPSLIPESKLRETRFDSNGTSATLSSLSHYFQLTVTEFGKDIEIISKETYHEDASFREQAGFAIEMRPTRPVSGGAPVRNVPQFSQEECDWLDSVIHVSSTTIDDI